jgi:signal transduction histidine kinase
VCRKIVDRHGGTLTARSVPQHGSTFVITLPSAPPAPGAAHAN